MRRTIGSMKNLDANDEECDGEMQERKKSRGETEATPVTRLRVAWREDEAMTRNYAATAEDPGCGESD